MKYTDRKKTPLKWHRTVSFVIQPLLILGVAWILFCMINELFSLHVPFAWQIFTPVLKSVDSSLQITSLGSMFWPVTGTFFATIVFLVLCIDVWIGLLRWKNSAKNLWLIYLLARTVCLIGGVVYLLKQSDAIRALQTFAVFDSMSRNLLHVIYALIIVICLWSLIFCILNFIYYHKRKLLFEPGYVQPEKAETGSVPVREKAVNKEENETESSEGKPTEEQDEKTEAIVVQQSETESSEEKNDSDLTTASENTDEDPKETGTVEEENPDQKESSSDTQETSVSDVKNEDQNAENEDVSETVQAEDKTEEDQKKPDETGSDDLPQRDPNQVFCPYCGAKLGKYDVLYCSHCGRKLA